MDNINKKKLIVTTSWDDGNKFDLKVLALLNKYNLRGTFYIPQNCIYKDLTDVDVKNINQTQEVGAHTISHVYFKDLSDIRIEEEIFGSKKYIEDITGKTPTMFCYPGGLFTESSKRFVQKAGFIGARTTKNFQFDAPVDNFDWGVTTQVYPFPCRLKNRSLSLFFQQLFDPLKNNWLGAREISIPFTSLTSWLNLSKAIFDYAVANNKDVFHLWGHSWEIDNYHMWGQLEEFFKYISNRSGCCYLTNSDTLVKLKNS